MWYKDGLRFKCAGCGHCCAVKGYVFISAPEVVLMAQQMGVNPREFVERYVRKVGDRFSLTEKGDACVVWDEVGGCSIYTTRPEQCRTFPFWDEYIDSPEGWATAKKRCPGVGVGHLYSVERVDKILKGKDTT